MCGNVTPPSEVRTAITIELLISRSAKVQQAPVA
jgi:hypothetical protein